MFFLHRKKYRRKMRIDPCLWVNVNTAQNELINKSERIKKHLQIGISGDILFLFFHFNTLLTESKFWIFCITENTETEQWLKLWCFIPLGFVMTQRWGNRETNFLYTVSPSWPCLGGLLLVTSPLPLYIPCADYLLLPEAHFVTLEFRSDCQPASFLGISRLYPHWF